MKQRKSKKQKGPRLIRLPQSERVLILDLGARGDGETKLTHEGKIMPLYAEFCLVGEEIDVSEVSISGGVARATKFNRITDAPNRVPAPCPHFEICGGCALQHLSETEIGAFKTRQLKEALHRKGLTPAPLNPIETVPSGTRRRARFAARHTQAGWVLGFNAAGSAKVIDQTSCFAITPGLNRGRDAVRSVLAQVTGFGHALDIQIDDTPVGLDIVFFFEDYPIIPLEDRQTIVSWCEDHNIARASIGTPAGSEPLVSRRDVTIDANGLSVARGPGAFSQPSVEGSALIAKTVIQALNTAQEIFGERSKSLHKALDLFSGGGAISVPLAKQGYSVTAFDSDADQIAALNTAAGHAGLPITATTRDLFKRPLEGVEIKNIDLLVFDPPRAGALEQVKQLVHPSLGESGPPVVVAISCNPTSLVRDLRILVDGGYTLHNVTPIDQFTWSPHLEAVALLTRA